MQGIEGGEVHTVTQPRGVSKCCFYNNVPRMNVRREGMRDRRALEMSAWKAISIVHPSNL